jgi:hypothetical protein
VKKNESVNNNVSRRSALVAGTVFSAGLVLTTPLLAAPDSSPEIETWEKWRGQVFKATGPASSRRPVSVKLKLAGVEYPEKRDPQLPEEFRDPFLVVFCPIQSGAMEQGEYQFRIPDGGRMTLFINETLIAKYSTEPVMQAAFN